MATPEVLGLDQLTETPYFVLIDNLPMPIEELARRTGIEPETVAAAMVRLEDGGLFNRAEREIRGIDAPPYAETRDGVRVNSAAVIAGRGVRSRFVHARDSLDVPGAMGMPAVWRDSSLTSAAPAGTMSGTTTAEGPSSAGGSPADGPPDAQRTGGGRHEPHTVLAPGDRSTEERAAGRPQTRDRPLLLGP